MRIFVLDRRASDRNARRTFFGNPNVAVALRLACGFLHGARFGEAKPALLAIA